MSDLDKKGPGWGPFFPSSPVGILQSTVLPLEWTGTTPMTRLDDTEGAPAYTRSSVMAYLRAAESERQRLEQSIADARARTAAVRSRISRLDALGLGTAPPAPVEPRPASVPSYVDEWQNLGGLPSSERCVDGGAPLAQWSPPGGSRGAAVDSDLDRLSREFPPPMTDGPSEWWPLDSGTTIDRD